MPAYKAKHTVTILSLMALLKISPGLNLFKFKTLFPAVTILLFVATNTVWSEEYVPVGSILIAGKQDLRGQWQATAYQLREEGDNFFETSQLPAKICFNEVANPTAVACHEAKGANNFPFQEATELKSILLDKSRAKNGVLFTVQHHGATLGKTRYISIWIYSKKDNTYINALEPLAITDQGEFKIYDSLIDKSGYLILADRIWASKTETLFAPHYYEIKIYKLIGDKYVFATKYKTGKKYKSLDNVPSINVIEPEKVRIIRVIKPSGN
ncbi:hypothetical protein [Geobacter pickeringii]|uniref:hypothetical protein n=1 Tax=Geobacter pickeringii TaxID=345632 RepID=UPI001186F719|nr:hypothetical protein [Geobacter pickeringii]